MSEYSDEVEVVEMAHAPEQLDTNGPGQKLRNARYALRKSEVDIARESNLSKDYIIALENDEYDKLPGEAFIRGYLRAYAQAVDLSPDDVVKQFNATEFAQQAQQSQQLISTAVNPQGNYRDKRIRWFAYGVVALFVLLFFTWWNSQTVPVDANSTQLTVSLQEEDIELVSTSADV